MVAGCAHPIGPLALTDTIGLDTRLRWPGRCSSRREEHLHPRRRFCSAKSRRAWMVVLHERMFRGHGFACGGNGGRPIRAGSALRGRRLRP
ncbi:MAG TPA: hypothetical protein VIW24_26980 [Aldersonia sp.]